MAKAKLYYWAMLERLVANAEIRLYCNKNGDFVIETDTGIYSDEDIRFALETAFQEYQEYEERFR